MKRPASGMKDVCAICSTAKAAAGTTCSWASCARNGWSLTPKWLKPLQEPTGVRMNTNFKIDETILVAGLKLRPAKWNDLEGVTQLIYDTCAADGDTIVAVTADELKHEWETPGFELEQDAFLVETSQGQIVGY